MKLITNSFFRHLFAQSFRCVWMIRMKLGWMVERGYMWCLCMMMMMMTIGS